MSIAAQRSFDSLRSLRMTEYHFVDVPQGHACDSSGLYLELQGDNLAIIITKHLGYILK